MLVSSDHVRRNLIQFIFLEDLEGLKVSHDLDGLEEGEDRILTLKDSRILDNEGSCFPTLVSFLLF